VPLAAADAPAPLQAGGIQVHTDADETFFMQPCDAHRNGCCHVYDNRPATCQKYRCELLKKYESGDVSWDDATERIARARALRETLTAELARVVPDAGRWSIVTWMTRVPTRQALATDRDLLNTWAPVMMRAAALLDWLEQHFRSPRRPADPSGGDAWTSRASAARNTPMG
jgi:hypothetical protein